jgi:methyl coenzyme M reductase gamma subunit
MTRRQLTTKQKKFVEGIKKGLNRTDAVRMAGYNTKSANGASVIASQLLNNNLIIKSLDEAGITNKSMAQTLKTHIENGIGVKTTASDSIKALELAYKIKMGTMNRNEENKSNTTNVYINELRMLDDKQLLDKLKSIEGEIVELR